jgi:hypothetical protein
MHHESQSRAPWRGMTGVLTWLPRRGGGEPGESDGGARRLNRYRGDGKGYSGTGRGAAWQHADGVGVMVGVVTVGEYRGTVGTPSIE